MRMWGLFLDAHKEAALSLIVRPNVACSDFRQMLAEGNRDEMNWADCLSKE